jgi:hypothetical protein
MKWFTPSNKTLQSPFPLLCETVSRGQPKEMQKVVSASYDAILAPLEALSQMGGNMKTELVSLFQLGLNLHHVPIFCFTTCVAIVSFDLGIICRVHS